MPTPLTLPSIEVFLDSHLGVSIDEFGNIIKGDRVYDCRPICNELAELIFALCENKHTAYIQFPTEGSLCQNPVIWDWKAWIVSNEREMHKRARSHKERVDMHLHSANVETMAQAAMKEFGFDKEKATAMAHRWVKQGNKGALMICKVDKLKTKEEEL